MKRSYLIASAIAILSIGSTAFAENAPAISMSGKSTFAGYAVKQNQKEGKSRAVHTSVESSELNFKVSNKSDDGQMRWGAVFTLYTMPNIQTGPNPETWKRAYGEFETRYGTIQIGNADSVTLDLIENGGSVLAGLGGYGGAKLYNVFNAASGVYKDTDPLGETFRATKILYKTPKLGFDAAGKHKIQLAADFTPNTEHRGNAKMVNNRSTSFATQGSIYGEHMVSYGAVYTMTSEEGLNINIGAGGLWGDSRDGRNTTHLGNYRSGKANTHNLHNYNAYKLGGIVKKDDVSFSWGYVYNGKSGIQKHQVSLDRNNTLYEQFAYGHAGHLCNVGVAKNFGPADLSFGYQYNVARTNRTQHTDGRVFSVSAAYKLMDGFQPFVDVNFIRHNTNNAAMLLTEYEGGRNVNVAEYPNLQVNDNRGMVVATGFKIRF